MKKIIKYAPIIVAVVAIIPTISSGGQRRKRSYILAAEAEIYKNMTSEYKTEYDIMYRPIEILN